MDKLYLLNAVAPDELTQGLIAYDLAKRLKLKHIVYHSVFRVEHFKDVPHFASKLAIENALRQFDVPFTIIRPNYFIQNDATLKDPLTKANIYPVPLGDVGVSACLLYTSGARLAVSFSLMFEGGGQPISGAPGFFEEPMQKGCLLYTS